MTILNFPENYHDRYVIIRTLDAGVHCGVLSLYTPATKHAVLRQARRIYSFNNQFTLSSIAKKGLADGRMSVELDTDIVLSDVCEVILANAHAEQSLRSYAPYDPLRDIQGSVEIVS